MPDKKKEELTSDDVWAMLTEMGKQIKEMQAKTDKQIAETSKEIKELARRMGGMDTNIGLHAEQFFQDSLAKTLVFGGEKYDYIDRNVSRGDKTGSVEFDIVLVNGKSIAIIEAKNRIHPDDVKTITEEKVAKLRKFFPEYQKYKVYLGLAGFSFSKKVLEDAKKLGVGIIKQVGDSIEIESDKLKAY